MRPSTLLRTGPPGFPSTSLRAGDAPASLACPELAEGLRTNLRADLEPLAPATTAGARDPEHVEGRGAPPPRGSTALTTGRNLSGQLLAAQGDFARARGAGEKCRLEGEAVLSGREWRGFRGCTFRREIQRILRDIAVLVDTHAHLQDEAFQTDLAQVICRGEQAGVKAVVVVGTAPQDSAEALSLAQTYPGVFAAAGVHPSEAHRVSLSEALAQIDQILQHPRIVAVGEIGLDLYRHESTASCQEEALEAQLGIASRNNLPVLVHSRRALGRLVEILRSWQGSIPGGVMHCFPGHEELAGCFVDMGFLLGIGGTVTFPKSHLPSLVKKVGLESIVLETDCPYLAPVPMRGKRNEPAYVRFVANHIASELGVPVAKVEHVTTGNACRLLNLPLAECQS